MKLSKTPKSIAQTSAQISGILNVIKKEKQINTVESVLS